MAIPIALIAGLITAGTAIYSAVANKSQSNKNRKSTEAQNRQNRQDEINRYEQSRRDEKKNWEAQNAYNHPLEQMNRLRQAGLNPHLVYGKGADATAESIKTSSYNTVNAPAPQSTFDPSTVQNIGTAFNQVYDLKLKSAQTDNVNQSTSLMQQEALYKAANTAKTVQETAKTKYELGLAQELKDTVIQNAKLTNEKLKVDTIYTVDNNQRQALKNTQDVKLTMEKILSEKIAREKNQKNIELMQEQLLQIKQNTNIRQYEQQLTDMGIYKSDPWYFRGLMNLINGNMDQAQPTNAIKKGYDSIMNRGAGATGKW